MRGHFDEALVKSLQAFKNSKMPLGLWFDSVADCIGSIIPLASFTKLLNHKPAWAEVEGELARVVQSSAIGRKAFGLAWRYQRSTKVKRDMATILGELILADVTKASVEKKRAEFVGKVKEGGRDAKQKGVDPQALLQIVYMGCTNAQRRSRASWTST